MKDTTPLKPTQPSLQSLADQLWPDVRPDGTTATPLIRVGFPVWFRWLLHAGVAGITFGRTVFLAPSVDRYGAEEIATIVRHELAHVAQYQRLGAARFLFQYLGEYARHRLAGRSAADAYRSISFELEAVTAEKLSGAGRHA